MRILAAALLATLALAAPAQAKGIAAAQICGATECLELGPRQTPIWLAAGGPPAAPPEQASPWYRIRVRVSSGGEEERFEPFTLRLAYVPAARVLHVGDQHGGPAWVLPHDPSVLDRLVAGMEPRPAATLRGLDAGDRLEARVDSVLEPPAQPRPSGDGAPWGALALAALAAAALAAGTLRVRGRRRVAAPSS